MMIYYASLLLWTMHLYRVNDYNDDHHNQKLIGKEQQLLLKSYKKKQQHDEVKNAYNKKWFQSV